MNKPLRLIGEWGNAHPYQHDSKYLPVLALLFKQLILRRTYLSKDQLNVLVLRLVENIFSESLRDFLFALDVIYFSRTHRNKIF